MIRIENVTKTYGQNTVVDRVNLVVEPGQIAALIRDGYPGWISLETHWPGPDGDKAAASLICARNLRRLIDAHA